MKSRLCLLYINISFELFYGQTTASRYRTALAVHTYLPYLLIDYRGEFLCHVLKYLIVLFP